MRRNVRVGVIDDEEGAVERLRRDFHDHEGEIDFSVEVLDRPRLSSINAVTDQRLAVMRGLDVLLIDNLLPRSGSGDRKEAYAVELVIRLTAKASCTALPILCTNDPHPNLSRAFCAFGGANVVDKNARTEIVRVVRDTLGGARWCPAPPRIDRLSPRGCALLPLIERTVVPAEITLLAEQAKPIFNAVLQTNPSTAIERDLLERYADVIAPDYRPRARDGGIRKIARQFVSNTAKSTPRLKLPVERVLELALADGYSWIPYNDVRSALDAGLRVTSNDVFHG